MGTLKLNLTGKHFVAAIVGLVGLVPSATTGVQAQEASSTQDEPPILKILSFNINALPDVLKSGDQEADQYARIAEILRQRRSEGEQPQVVLLQEAFDSKSAVITDTTGYAYVVRGPGRKEPSKEGKAHWNLQTRKPYSNFDDPQKFMGSGLVILSDFPIVDAQHKAFDSDSCAGIDCLSNKAILLARLEVPGLDTPLDIINSHFNSRRSAAAPKKWTLKAHQRQTDTLHWFLTRVHGGNPLVIAGDFNTKAQDRYRYFRDRIDVADVAELCLSLSGRCRVADGTSEDSILYNTNDKQFIAPSKGVALMPMHIERNFTEQIGGIGLSDHLGYEVHYRLLPVASTATHTDQAEPVWHSESSEISP